MAPYGNLKNTPVNPLIDGNKLPGMDKAQNIFDSLEKFNTLSKGFFDIINGIVWYVTNPKWIIIDISKNCYSLFLIIALIGFLAFILGYKKGSKITLGSIISFIFIKLLAMVVQ